MQNNSGNRLQTAHKHQENIQEIMTIQRNKEQQTNKKILNFMQENKRG